MDRRDVQQAMWQDVDSGWAVTAEFLSAIGVWFGIGWLLDRWLETGPWLLLAGAALGFGLGMYLVWLRLQDATRDEHARFSYRTKPGHLLAREDAARDTGSDTETPATSTDTPR